MAYDLTAVLRLKDKFSNQMKKATKQTERFSKITDLTDRKMSKLSATASSTASKIGRDFQKAYRDAKPDSFFNAANSAGKKLTAVGTAGAGALGIATKSAMSFEDAFSSVRKTVDATEKEFAALKQGIRNMTKEIPATHEEIAAVAEAAGQLGIQTDAILGFTETMVNLGVATNMTAENAATSLARLANITQMPQSNFDRLGSTVVALGNNLATTESEIVEMGLRLAGAGHQVGLTESQILGFAGALSSVGIEADAGGSAFSKVMINMASEVATNGKNLDLFAKTAGMSASEFKKAFKEDASGAIISFVEGLGKIKKEGGNVFGVLDGLGLSEIRVRDALLRASGAGDLFRNSIKLGSEAWEENVALTNEAAEKYKTAMSQWKILKNTIRDISISMGEIILPDTVEAIHSLKAFAERLNNLSPAIKKVMVMTLLAGTAFALIGGPILWFISLIPNIAAGFVTIGKGALLVGKGFMFLMSPAGLAIAAIAALIFAGVMLYRNWDVVKAKAIELWTSLTETFNSIKETIINKIEAIKATFSEWVSGAINIGKDFVQNVIDGFLTMWDSLKQTARNIWDSIISIFKGKSSVSIAIEGGGAAAKVKGSHYHGLDRVPYDGYLARLHKGETVLPRKIANLYRTFNLMPRTQIEYTPQEGRPVSRARGSERVNEAKESRRQGKGTSGGFKGVTITGNTFNVRKESDIESIANALAIKVLQAQAAGA